MLAAAVLFSIVALLASVFRYVDIASTAGALLLIVLISALVEHRSHAPSQPRAQAPQPEELRP